MNLSPHFTLEELTRSGTAQARGIDNSAPPDVLANLRRVAETLEAFRAELSRDAVDLRGYAITVTSGYRCPELNEAVGGAGSAEARRHDPNSRPSAHLYGLAADFVCPAFGSPADILARLSATPGFVYDQLINERDGAGNVWVHVGLAPAGVTPRMMTFAAFQHVPARAGS